MSDYDADAIIRVAQEAATPTALDQEKIYLTHAGGSAVVLDGEQRLANPRRKKGTITLYDAKSLEEYFARQLLALGDKHPTMLYADREKAQLIAIFNDHAESPGWRDHRADVHLRTTPEWRHWKDKDGQLRAQVDFAEHIEQGLLEITDPDGATILELAQTFEANQKVAFKSATTLADGSRQLLFAQTIEAKAGQTGQLTIPKQFELTLRPFEGSAFFKLTARLRYRIENETLRIGYTLVRPHDVLDAAFEDVVKQVEQGTSVVALRGTPDVAGR